MREISKSKLILYGTFITILAIAMVISVLFLIRSIDMHNNSIIDNDYVRADTMTLTNRYNSHSLQVNIPDVYNTITGDVYFDTPSSVNIFINNIIAIDSAYKVTNYKHNYLTITHNNGEYYQLKRTSITLNDKYGMAFSTSVDAEYFYHNTNTDREDCYKIPILIELFNIVNEAFYGSNTLNTLYQHVQYSINGSIDDFIAFYSGFDSITVVAQDYELLLSTNAEHGSASITITFNITEFKSTISIAPNI